MSDLHAPPFWFISQTLLRGARTAMNVTAQSPCHVMFVPQIRLTELLVEYPELRMHLFRLVAGMFHRMTEALSDSLIRDSDQRCIAVLLRIAERRHEGDMRASLPIGQTDLAGLANVSRQKIGDVLRLLQDQGLVELGYRRIDLLDPAQLRARLDD